MFMTVHDRLGVAIKMPNALRDTLHSAGFNDRPADALIYIKQLR